MDGDPRHIETGRTGYQPNEAFRFFLSKNLLGADRIV